MAIVEGDIDRVRQAVSIVDVVSEYVQLRRVGRNLVGLCPFHSEKSGSFNVREDTGRYKCFGCDAGGDVFTFVQEIERLDFVGAVERLAGKVGVELRYTSGPQGGKDRKRRQLLLDAVAAAADWYHERLLGGTDAREARDYLRGRSLAGDVARTFRLGWAPDDWDQLANTLRRDRGVPDDVLVEAGLAFVNKANKLQDSFRGRVMFPIYDESGTPVAFGGRVLPGSKDPAKYKNSTESPIYAKSRVLYGLNWAKTDVVRADEVVVCEGYTDVIGFHRAGLTRAVATCGTALTEDHVKLLKRFATRVVLAFDADAAGQGAAARFYEWEKRYDVAVSVARFPEGRDPADLADTAGALEAAVSGATPFLGFRLQRVLDAGDLRNPEGRARTAEAAMRVIAEHPSVDVRKLYAAQVASHTGVSSGDLVRAAERGPREPYVASAPVRQAQEGAGFVALALLIHRWDDIAPWLIESLFADDAHRAAFRAIVSGEGDVAAALGEAEGEAAQLIERAAVVDFDADPVAEARTLIGAAVRRVLASRVTVSDPEEIRADRAARITLDDLARPDKADQAAVDLLGWLTLRTEAVTP